MALTAFPELSKLASLQDDTKYAYVHVTPSGSKPTFLLLHGFPSSSFDWRHQIVRLKGAGYGVIAPDLLGYGDTDKPVEVEKYAFKAMSGHIAEILDKEGLQKVVGVGHDWGSGLLSRLANYHTERFLAIITISVSYLEPGIVYDLDAFNVGTAQAFGYPTFGYWKFFDSDDAAEVLDRNPKSTTSLMYPEGPETWMTDLCPLGGARTWITSGTATAHPSWITEDEAALHECILAQGGYTGPLNWYKSVIKGINDVDDATIEPEQKYLTLPNMLVVSTKDFATRPELQEMRSREWVKDLRIETLDCGHWIPLERSEELFALLEDFTTAVTEKN
ncbi:hypothetical protein MMC30_002640 [Trapelia coarctata]|nr:hypothetical protein [Trapelia coarctata]